MRRTVRKLIICVASEAIALVLRRPGVSRPYLYPQIFAGLSYMVASLFLLELWRVLRCRRES
jgi:hypothetical protein